MSPELIVAITERRKHGFTKEVIAAEVLAAGYTMEQFEAAFSASLTPATLVPYGELIPRTWALMREQVGVLAKAFLLAGAIFVVGAAIVLTSDQVYDPSGPTALSVTMLTFLAGMGALFILAFALLRALVMRSEKQLFRTHIAFIIRRSIVIFIVLMLVSIITQIGYVFFIVPGLMAAVYLFFAHIYVVTGEASGFRALALSTELVYDRFFAAVGRVLFISLIIFLAASVTLFMGSIPITILATALEPLWSMTVFPFVFVAILAFVIIITYASNCSLIVVYESLRATPKAVSSRYSVADITKFYRLVFYIALGLFLLLLAVVGLFAFPVMDTLIWSSLEG